MNSKRIFEYISLCFMCLFGVFRIGLQEGFWSWTLWLAGVYLLFFSRRQFAKDIFLIFISLLILGFTPITTDVSYTHIFWMGSALILAVAIPYLISRYVYKDYLVRFRFHHGRKWYRKEVLYILVTAVISYFLLPFYLRNTGAYLNWGVEPGASFIIRLFIGTNALGIWDELFFVSTVLGIFRRYLSFLWANILQSILFTAFLFELGFTGWGFIMIYIFALVQGYVFKKTDSLFYVITIHLTLDLILFLALIFSHHPSWMPIFVT
jgi:membrane protease YdiL (CAAX protease family)